MSGMKSLIHVCPSQIIRRFGVRRDNVKLNTGQDKYVSSLGVCLTDDLPSLLIGPRAVSVL